MSLALRLVGAGIALLLAGVFGVVLFGALWTRIWFGVAIAVVVGGLLCFAWRNAGQARAGLGRI